MNLKLLNEHFWWGMIRLNTTLSYFLPYVYVRQIIALVLMQVPGRFREMTAEEKQKAGGGSFTMASVVDTLHINFVLEVFYILSLLPMLLGIHNVQWMKCRSNLFHYLQVELTNLKRQYSRDIEREISRTRRLLADIYFYYIHVSMSCFNFSKTSPILGHFLFLISGKGFKSSEEHQICIILGSGCHSPVALWMAVRWIWCSKYVSETSYWNWSEWRESDRDWQVWDCNFQCTHLQGEVICDWSCL